MGKGVIVSGDGSAEYTVELDYGKELYDLERELLDTQEDELDTLIEEQEEKVEDAKSALAIAVSQLSTAIDIYIASEQAKEDKEELDKRLLKKLEIESKVSQIETALGKLQLTRSNLQGRREQIAKGIYEETRKLWCADYTTQAEGTVGILEVNGEQPTYLIAPGGASGGFGLMYAREIQTPAQLFANAALLPGWQKWLPTHRAATITAIDRKNNTCELDLHPAKSSAQDLPINLEDSLSNVPIEYMTCNHAAFVVHDEVLVAFNSQEWEHPVVIGFLENPRTCAPARVSFLIFSGSEYVTDQVTYGFPLGGTVYAPGDIWNSVDRALTIGSYIGNQFGTLTREASDTTSNNPNPPTETGGWNGYSNDAEIQFDKAYVAEAHNENWNDGYERQRRTTIRASLLTAPDEKLETLELTPDNLVSGGGILVTNNDFRLNFTAASIVRNHRPDFTPSPYTAYRPYLDPDGQPVEVWTHSAMAGTQVREGYTYRWLDAENNLYFADPQEYTDRLLQIYDPPAELILHIGHASENYVLEYFGPTPNLIREQFRAFPYTMSYATYLRKDLLNEEPSP